MRPNRNVEGLQLADATLEMKPLRKLLYIGLYKRVSSQSLVSTQWVDGARLPDTLASRLLTRFDGLASR